MIPKGITKNTIQEICKFTKLMQECIEEMDNNQIDLLERIYEEQGC